MTFFDLSQLRAHESETTLPSPGERRDFSADVPEGWRQGSGAFGGLVMALLVRAVETAMPGRPLRSLTAEIPAPVNAGATTLSVEVLRTGQSVTVVAARLIQNGEIHAHAVAVLGAARRVEPALNHVDLTMPAAEDWRAIAPVAADMPLLPQFARHFEFRFVDGLPFQGASKSGATGWIRLRDPGPTKDAALVVAHVDAWWPAEFPRMTAPRPMVTSAFTMQMVGGADVWTTDAPLLHKSRTLSSRDGYVTEVRELWTEAGELVALNQQTMVIIK